MTRKQVTIVGAGLCGSLLAIILQRRGFQVSVLERRQDPRRGTGDAGRSINLALSARGLRALRHAGILSQVEPLLMPMRGRIIHEEDGSTEFQSYGQREGEQIYSVSRAELNRILIDAADGEYAASLAFGQEAHAFDPRRGELEVTDLAQGTRYVSRDGPVIAADGAGSAIRRALGPSLGAAEDLLPHGYKELGIPAGPGRRHRIDAEGLHIWPRGGFMLIALPNPGGDFTLTLFMPNEGGNSFASIADPDGVRRFFLRWFADVVPLIPDLAETFLTNPVGVLGTVRCRRWHAAGDVLLIGDAAHAIVPFHGQGMNLAFEDCLLLERAIEMENDWAQAFAAFETKQRPNADAIADMALENYVEMRDTVRDPKYKLRRALSFELERRLPDRFIPRYSMVMFHADIPYAVAQQRGAVQQQLLDDLVRNAGSLDEIDMRAAETMVRERLPRLARE